MMKSLCVFCGSSSGKHPRYEQMAKEFGKKMAEHEIELIYGGGSIGIMGTLADAVLEHGGIVRGVMPELLMKWEVGHENLTELRVVDSMHARKKEMYDMSDAFIAIPGGMGTLDELCEIVTWAQLKKHTKPCFIMNEHGFFDHLIKHFEHINTEGFLSDDHLKLVNVVDFNEACQLLN